MSLELSASSTAGIFFLSHTQAYIVGDLSQKLMKQHNDAKSHTAPNISDLNELPPVLMLPGLR